MTRETRGTPGCRWVQGIGRSRDQLCGWRRYGRRRRIVHRLRSCVCASCWLVLARVSLAGYDIARPMMRCTVLHLRGGQLGCPTLPARTGPNPTDCRQLPRALRDVATPMAEMLISFSWERPAMIILRKWPRHRRSVVAARCWNCEAVKTGRQPLFPTSKVTFRYRNYCIVPTYTLTMVNRSCHRQFMQLM